jgi:hypothetical protein|tara:strand:- start:782 stop:1066 length:285 start_codon:yes stop_codon:yes gene_type:complete
MAKELNENLGFKVSIKTLLGIGVGMATVISMWFMLQADIAEAKTLPVPPPQDVSRMEFDMKDRNIRLSIENTEKAVDEMKINLRRMEDKIDKLR